MGKLAGKPVLTPLYLKSSMDFFAKQFIEFKITGTNFT